MAELAQATAAEIFVTFHFFRVDRKNKELDNGAGWTVSPQKVTASSVRDDHSLEARLESFNDQLLQDHEDSEKLTHKQRFGNLILDYYDELVALKTKRGILYML